MIAAFSALPIVFRHCSLLRETAEHIARILGLLKGAAHIGLPVLVVQQAEVNEGS